MPDFSSMPDIEIRQATSASDLEAIHALFVEYAESLGFSLCFQGFDEELATLPGRYAPPSGRLLIACKQQVPVGCVGLRALEDEGVCEMKRLYVKPETRGAGLGWRLAADIIREAQAIGYRQMRLDTLKSMKSADTIYRNFGFYAIPAYYHNPHPEVRYFELNLESHAGNGCG